MVWKIPHGNGFAAPVVAAGVVYHPSMKDEKETLFALDAATGKEKWAAPIDDPFKDGFGTGPRSAATVDGERVYVVSCRGELKCLSTASGKVVWSKNYVKDFGAVFIGEKGTSQGAARHGNAASPLVDGNELIVVPGGKGAAVACLNKATGDVVWKSEDDGAGYAPALVCRTGRWCIFARQTHQKTSSISGRAIAEFTAGPTPSTWMNRHRPISNVAGSGIGSLARRTSTTRNPRARSRCPAR